MKLLFPISILVCCLFVHQATCFKLSKNGQSPLDLLTSKIQKKSNEKEIWYFTAITREEFKKMHEKDLTSDVRKQIFDQMKGQCKWIGQIFKSRVEKMKLDMANKVIKNEKRSEDKNYLQVMMESLGTKDGFKNNDEYEQPVFVQSCLAEIKPEDENDLKKMKYTSCAAHIFETTSKNLENYVMDSVDDFIDAFEEYLKGMVSFVQLFYQYTEDTGASYMKRNAGEEDVRKLMEDYLADVLRRK